MHNERFYTLSASCPDRVGIIARVSGFIAEHQGWILESSYHADPGEGCGSRYFMRIEVKADSLPFPLAEFRQRLAPIAEELQMDFGHCRLSIAAPEGSGFDSVDDIKDGTVVATSFPNLTQKYFERLGKQVEITKISGAAEVTPHLGVADIISDLVSSGSTLKMNHLKEIAVITNSQAVVIANHESYKHRREEIDELVSAMRSVMDAENKKYLMADVPTVALDEVRKYFPGIAGPTVMNIAGREDVVAVHVVIDKDQVYDAIIRLKRLGASGILITPIDRMVP